MSEYIGRLQETIASLIRDLSQEELAYQCQGKWGIAEVLEHLYLTYTGTIKGCERCLAAKKPLATPQNLKQRMSAFAVTTVGYYPSGVKSPSTVRPKGVPCEEVVASITQQIASMDAWISRCEDCYGKQTKLMDHPIMGALNADQWRKFHWVHGMHHIKQISQLRKEFAADRKSPQSMGA
jgi:hypothetical protein